MDGHDPAGAHIHQQHVIIVADPTLIDGRTGQAIAIGIGDIIARAIIGRAKLGAGIPARIAEGCIPVAGAIDVAVAAAIILPVFPRLLAGVANIATGFADIAAIAIALGRAQVALVFAQPLLAAAGFAIGLGGSDAGDDGGRKKAKDDDLAHISTPINLEARGRFQPLQAGQVPLPTC